MNASPVLLPQPRRIQPLDGTCDPTIAPYETIDPAHVPHRDGYTLTLDRHGISIVAHDAAGAFYARQTLEQIKRQSPRTAPCMRIDDYPDFPNRGVMLDISRD